MSLKILNLLLVLVSTPVFAQNYKLSRTAVVFSEANGVAVSLLETLAGKNFEVVFVFNGKHHYDSDSLIPKYATKVIQCSMVDTEYKNCDELVAYAAESKPLDVLIDLQSDSAAEVNALYTLFEATRKPRIYALLSSHAMYVPCRDSTDVREYGEYHCPPMGDELVAIPAGMHSAEYEAGRRMLETERELHRLMEARSMSYLALRAAPLFGAREPVESFLSSEAEGEKKTRLLTWLLLSGVSAHVNQPLRLSAAYRNMKWSILYAGDLTKMAGAIEHLANLPAAQPFSRTYNLATARVTLKKLVTSLAAALGMSEKLNVEFVEEAELAPGMHRMFYPDFFPPTHTKPIDTGYIQHELRFMPTDLNVALKETVAFYRDALMQFDAKAQPTHVDEPIRVAIDTLVKGGLCTHEQIDNFIGWLRTHPYETPTTPDEKQQEGHTEL